MLNAAHALHRMLAAVLPDASGRLPDELRAGRAAPSDEEQEGWRRLPGGASDIAHLGGRPHDPGAVGDRYRRIGFEPAIDVHGIEVGDATQVRTQIPATARAMAVDAARTRSGQRRAVAGAGAAPAGRGAGRRRRARDAEQRLRAGPRRAVPPGDADRQSRRWSGQPASPP